MAKTPDEDKPDANPTVIRRKAHYGQASCKICPPFEGENRHLRGRKPKSDKYKSKRKGR